MNRDEDDCGSSRRESDNDNMRQPRRSKWLRGFPMPRPQDNLTCSPEERQPNVSDRSLIRRVTALPSPTRRSLRLGDDGFWSNQKAEKEDNSNESGKASNSSGMLKKAKTFTGIFGKRKGKKSDKEVAGDPEDDFEIMRPLAYSESSSVGKGNNTEEEKLDSVSKSDKLRSMKVSNANRTMFFKGDLPPCSPLSTKVQTSALTAALNGGRGSDEVEDKFGSLKQEVLNVEPSQQEADMQKDVPFDSEIHGLQSHPASARASNIETHLNMRLGSMAFEPESNVSRLKSSSLPSPRKVPSSPSNSPNYTHKSPQRPTSILHEVHDRTRDRVRKEHDCPWGVQDMSETDREGDDRTSLGKNFRRLSMVLRLTRKKSVQSSSDSLNLSNE